MSSSRKAGQAAALLALVWALGAQAQPTGGKYTGIGRTATPAEVAAWDIDVRPDFKGLPAGSGSVAAGQQVWEGKCAGCHGVFGESNEVFNPIVGGTTAEDVVKGRVGSLVRNDYPGRTTLMKLSSVASLWDYVRRAMPWNTPKSLSVDEVYAVTAYMLNLGGVLPDDFTLSGKSMAQAQQRLPNRNGMTTQHALWPGKEFGGTARPDVAALPCMSNCVAPAARQSTIPAFARNSHGNLAEQNRLVGPQRGVETAQVAQAAAPASESVQPLLQKHSCSACHAADAKLVGPSWADIGKKHPGQAGYLAAKIRSGGVGAWGAIPMPPQSLSEEEAARIATWLAQGMSR
ncbi:MAG: c-type cytochrome [Burkholderiales bacterium]|nr:c-type cytochrome [Burkholderiales bacterium]